jgi:hypothetical protein
LKAFLPGEESDLYEALENVIIFSSKGKRPETDKMAGGDCDGDVYWVCWEPILLETFQEVEPAEPKEKNIKKEVMKIVKVKIESVSLFQKTQHFLDNLEYDLLGKIANEHCRIGD